MGDDGIMFTVPTPGSEEPPGGELVEVKRWNVNGEPMLTIHRNPDHPYCFHNSGVSVDDNARTVECRKCGVRLDPIDVLMKFARGEMRFVDVREQRKALEKQIAQLKEEERRVKARLKRAREKEVTE
ncbi:MAG: hypothetical protein PHX83_06565 [Acidobacteriia bacterium]|nr:hypothetical protein [Terriglobia bacterium]